MRRPHASFACAVALLGLSATVLPSCMPAVRPAVSLRVKRHPKTPSDAFVTIDEEYIGPLGYVAAHGVRLPLGTHRISVERRGYFPYDTTVEASSDTIYLNVHLKPIPD